MGLVVNRDLKLEQMFNAFAVDPKKKAPKKPDDKKDKTVEEKSTTDNKSEN
ncbi:hypothetical protein FC26_GL002455 [Paucilactobacillus vaccinostercus DSM 20634]|jgi:hypothetical protein|uniref:Uncharacterized protein n=1 Tax=Paucilactobacillus vaccinostercus DSM 20634 TaxID=1423813 RepID=A0A0R2A5P8_9LACO|nr:SPJ_0845 family protein [Paucilactobacillus vaccinostercus]KRM62391.1 hypothetical protein FC26_GL002455 [Paucilactobacillus vaccinostercus DSM 20634]